MSSKNLIFFSLIFLAVFIWLTIQVDIRSYFAWDFRIISFVKSFTSPFTIAVLTAVSWPGYAPQVFYIISFILSFLFVIKQRLSALTAFVSFSAISAIVYLAKSYIGRFRPDAHIYIYSGADRSFPSGHMASYTVILGFLFYLIYQKFPSAKTLLLLTACYSLLIFLTGFSRIYLGYHWPTDVVGGFSLGFSWLLFTIAIYKFLKFRT